MFVEALGWECSTAPPGIERPLHKSLCKLDRDVRCRVHEEHQHAQAASTERIFNTVTGGIIPKGAIWAAHIMTWQPKSIKRPQPNEMWS